MGHGLARTYFTADRGAADFSTGAMVVDTPAGSDARLLLESQACEPEILSFLCGAASSASWASNRNSADSGNSPVLLQGCQAVLRLIASIAAITSETTPTPVAEALDTVTSAQALSLQPERRAKSLQGHRRQMNFLQQDPRREEKQDIQKMAA